MRKLPATFAAAIFFFSLCLGAQTAVDFQLPPKSAFPASMPRYPNAWFYVDAALAPSYDAAVKLVAARLREAMRLPEFFPPFDNPEGCDYEVRIEHLQPWIDTSDRERRSLQHAHAFHMRYYYSALAAAKLEKVRIRRGGAERDFYRLPASAHYEVEHANPHHADVESCPICGRAGEYAAMKGNLVEQVHDPLGLELMMTGKIRGAIVRAEDWERRPVGSVESLRDQFCVTTFTLPGQTGDRNTLRIGIALLEGKRRDGRC